ncbi:hypothetical protein [Candidatus Electronema sp. JC]|jgi:hypothetical protein|uniref:hypothetical protein n=1 Tax=Candidatus Electronema sp. JC TaxID=3401570 RepID=UPI003B439E10
MTTTDKIDAKQALDPGMLMLAGYVLGVAALVLAGWFAAVGSIPADSGSVTVQAEQAVAVK